MQRVFITGGAGFLGRAFMRWLASQDLSVRCTIYSRDESKHMHARQEFPQHNYILGDVRDSDRLEVAMAGHDTVIHMAAMKYVPEGEKNVAEAIGVNVDGSRNVVRAAIRNQVERVVGISTDKACQPVNVYGMTKLLMERVFQEADSWSDTKFNLVRYGNVISSTGSVIPLFQRQAREGCITLTDPEMTRFWLTVDQAVSLVHDALMEPRGGTVLIPRLSAMTMLDVAIAAVSLVSYEAGLDYPDFKTIGQRFGEKQHEFLLGRSEFPYTTFCGSKLMRMTPVTEGVCTEPFPRPYSSDDPDSWFTIEQMARIIEEANE